ncbi:MAG: relaxase/mobilization nuclease domain-containing protein [Tannerella sp.]|jgi:hypothetical protein|nr:relaxase/mobilization nuclease domain-containing protein [Tannerella sp.]
MKYENPKNYKTEEIRRLTGINPVTFRIDIDGKVYQTDFVSNRAAKAAEELSREMGLTIANEVYRAKEHQKQKTMPKRYEAKKQLQDIAYKEFRNTNNKTAKKFIDALKRQGVTVELVRNKQDKIYGIRFHFGSETFKASEIGKEFGLRSLFLHYGQNIDGKMPNPKHFEQKQFAPQNQSTALETATGIIGGLLDVPTPTSDYDADEAALQRQTQTKKKKRRGMRW